MRRRSSPSGRAIPVELAEVLSSSTNLLVVMNRLKDVLPKFLPVDRVAFCVSKPGRPFDYDWVTDMPRVFAERYTQEIAPQDIVRQSVEGNPGTVMRDSDMVSRRVMTESALYRSCREMQLGIERAMAVRFDLDGGMHAGLTLYRGPGPAFSTKERDSLQDCLGMFANTINNCRTFGEMEHRTQIQETVARQQGVEFMVLTSAFQERMRTPFLTRLMERYFTRGQLGRLGLPRELVERLSALMKTGGAESRLSTWVGSNDDAGRTLRAVFFPLPGQQDEWALVFKESRHAIAAPESWRERLSDREFDVAECVLHFWDAETIGEHLGITKNTVKQHLKGIRQALGTENERKLISLARRS